VSLSSLIDSRADLRDGLRTRISRPKISFPTIKATPQTKNYGIVGAAFDYLLRFHLERINPMAKSSPWVARSGAELLNAQDFSYDLDKQVLSQTRSSRRKKSDTYLEEAEAARRDYVRNGKLSDNLLISALRLAYLEVAYRVGPERVDLKGLTSPDRRDVADLRALFRAIDDSHFLAKNICILNPKFGDASRLVGGADADLIIDGSLIDIKNTKIPQLDTRDLYQLVGYYLLYGFAGVSAETEVLKHQVTTLSIYYSRFAYLWKIPAEELIPPAALPECARWFFNSVCSSATVRARCVRSFSGALAKYIDVAASGTPRLHGRLSKRSTTGKSKPGLL
jgi:hypothetical protein